MRVAVLGGGPSGMFAAWAAIQWGADVRVYDRDPDALSVGANHGVFALWDDCDLYLSQKRSVKVGVIGGKGLSPDEVELRYARKVYANESVASSTSISHYVQREERTCYNHAEAYAQILDFVGKERIIQHNFTFTRDASNLDLWDISTYYADVTICTLPANLLFKSGIWPCKTAYVYHGDAPVEDAFMIYNVNESIPWYRCSAIFGKFSMEYAEKPDNGKSYIKVKKVLDPPRLPDQIWGGFQDNLIFAGRFGAWEKNVLTEDVYWQVLRRLFDIQHSGTFKVRPIYGDQMPVQLD